MDLEVREGFPKQSMEMSGPLPKLGWGGGGGSTLQFVDELLKIVDYRRKSTVSPGKFFCPKTTPQNADMAGVAFIDDKSEIISDPPRASITR